MVLDFRFVNDLRERERESEMGQSTKVAHSNDTLFRGLSTAKARMVASWGRIELDKVGGCWWTYRYRSHETHLRVDSDGIKCPAVGLFKLLCDLVDVGGRHDGE